MAFLDLLRPRRPFKLPAFQPTPLEFDAQAGELLLDAIVTGLGEQSRVVRLHQPVPTAGELRARIEDHLRTSPASAPVADPAEELRNALAELRRSLG